MIPVVGEKEVMRVKEVERLSIIYGPYPKYKQLPDLITPPYSDWLARYNEKTEENV